MVKPTNSGWALLGSTMVHDGFHDGTSTHPLSVGFFYGEVPSGYVKIAIENDHL